MTDFHIITLPTDVADRWRTAKIDDYGNPLAPIVADKPAAFPCRHCLRDAEPGELLLLASHSPFAQPGPYKEVGPVFVHASRCERWRGADVPLQLRRRLLALRGYDRGQAMVDAEVVEGAAFEAELARLFSRRDVDFVHVRFARPGCFACRVERG
jgi:Protein of unknown function (DUF1203)